jgi:predicted AAA+ superfamily ATPase
MLYPFSQHEILRHYGRFELERQLDRDLIFGSYPETYGFKGDEERTAFLRELHSSYLFKDILEMGGIRNAAIGDYRPFAERPDRGALWENFVIAERRKRATSLSTAASSYFWRLTSGAEIDYVEDSNGQVSGWEIKLSPEAKANPPKRWIETYPGASWAKVDRSNYLEFVAADSP